MPGERVLVIWSLKSTQIVGIVSVAAFTERKNVSYHRPPSFFSTSLPLAHSAKAKQSKAGREPRAESREPARRRRRRRAVAWRGVARRSNSRIDGY